MTADEIQMIQVARYLHLRVVYFRDKRYGEIRYERTYKKQTNNKNIKGHRVKQNLNLKLTSVICFRSKSVKLSNEDSTAI